jgi:hypothetical protein
MKLRSITALASYFSQLTLERHVVLGALTYYKYHGANRILSRSKPLPDVVLSTYDTVAADVRQGGGILNCFHWYRIVLDEGKNS